MSAAVAGTGSSTHFAFEMIKRNAGIDVLMVPYKGSAPAVNDVLGNHAQFMIDAPPVTLEFVKSGRLRPMAVTGKKRLPSAPDVPTFDEAGMPGIEASGFQGIFVPVGTPPAVVSKLSDAVVKALAQPDVRERFASQGLDTSPLDAKDFAVFIANERPKWAGLAKAANIKAEQ